MKLHVTHETAKIPSKEKNNNIGHCPLFALLLKLIHVRRMPRCIVLAEAICIANSYRLVT